MTGDLRPKGGGRDRRGNIQRENHQGPKLTSCGCGGTEGRGLAAAWVGDGRHCFFMTQENRRGSKSGEDGGESRYRTRCLQAEMLPRHSRPDEGRGRQVQLHSASPSCRRPCKDQTSWGKAKARGTAGCRRASHCLK